MALDLSVCLFTQVSCKPILICDDNIILHNLGIHKIGVLGGDFFASLLIGRDILSITG